MRKIVAYLADLWQNVVVLFSKKNVKLFYYDAEPNFGDLLNIYLFDKIAHLKVKKARLKKANIVAVGSVLTSFFSKKSIKFVKKPIVVWGSGVVNNIENSSHLKRALDVRAVRGYLTLECLKNKAHVSIAENVAVGDPGLLISRFFDAAKVTKKYKLGIIPHYVDKNNILLNKIKVSNSVVLDIQLAPEEFIYQLAQCEAVISSAMHGLIAADSLGIPNIRMILSDEILGGDYKFNDYYSALGISHHQKIDLRKCSFDENDLAKLLKNYSVSPSVVLNIQDNLLKTFPLK